ncbi:MAG TPA: winged helix-turn-helix transcriptional regulator [Solirubrobacteraceae bacterium]|nr:winged helix-turn-helix transcriptional regulator [Solirubrobacteraceae bacterium]
MDGQQDMQAGGAVAPLGRLALKLIAQRWVIAVLLELADGPLRPHELERRVVGLSHAGLMRRLAELARNGVVVHTRSREIPPRAYYGLTRCGEELLTIADRAARWEEQTRVRSRTLPGAWALRVVADPRALEVLRALALAPSGPRKLGRRIAPVGHAALMRRLAGLTLDGLLIRQELRGGVRYELAEDTRGLAELAILAMGWELARDAGRDEARPSDLLGMLRLLAPAASPPPELQGVCLLRVDGPGEREPGLSLAAAGGSLRALPASPVQRPAAILQGSLQAWLRALLAGSPSALVTVADPVLATGVLDALAALLCVPRLDSLFDLIKIS